MAKDKTNIIAYKIDGILHTSVPAESVLTTDNFSVVNFSTTCLCYYIN